MKALLVVLLVVLAALVGYSVWIRVRVHGSPHRWRRRRRWRR